jgi:hypothetical protein
LPTRDIKGQTDVLSKALKIRNSGAVVHFTVKTFTE